MFLISVYFDQATNKVLSGYIDKLADVTGNRFMKDCHVPPHMTISAAEHRDAEVLIASVKKLEGEIAQGDIRFVSVGALFPYVFYITPVLNGYLLNLSEQVYSVIKDIPDIRMNKYYKPMQWLPHVTIGKTLNKIQMRKAFEIMQESFSVSDGKVVRLGLARTNPHEDIWEMSL